MATDFSTRTTVIRKILAKDALVPSPVSNHPSFGPIKSPSPRFQLYKDLATFAPVEIEKPYSSPFSKKNGMHANSNKNLDVY